MDPKGANSEGLNENNLNSCEHPVIIRIEPIRSQKHSFLVSHAAPPCFICLDCYKRLNMKKLKGLNGRGEKSYTCLSEIRVTLEYNNNNLTMAYTDNKNQIIESFVANDTHYAIVETVGLDQDFRYFEFTEGYISDEFKNKKYCFEELNVNIKPAKNK